MSEHDRAIPSQFKCPTEMTSYQTNAVLWLGSFRRKLSSKSKKWKSIFNLGRSGSDSKSKLSRNGSVFVRGQRLSGKNQ